MEGGTQKEAAQNELKHILVLEFLRSADFFGVVGKGGGGSEKVNESTYMHTYIHNVRNARDYYYLFMFYVETLMRIDLLQQKHRSRKQQKTFQEIEFESEGYSHKTVLSICQHQQINTHIYDLTSNIVHLICEIFSQE